MRPSLTRLVGVSLISLALCAGCFPPLGHSSSDMSESEAQALAEQIQTHVGKALNSSQGGLSPNSAGLGPLDLRTDDVSCDDYGNCQVNIQSSFRTDCTAGGNLQSSGSLTGTINSNGSGTLLWGDTVTITDWQCIGSYIVNGDPYVSAAGHISPLSGGTITIGGGFQWIGPSSGSCQISLTVNFDANGNGSATGTVCGYSVSITT
jgi:hypothetical protein